MSNVKGIGHYLGTYSGNQLKHRLNEYGIWKVHGEDPNAGMGGSHRPPFLGYFEGKLEDVIAHCAQLPGFWTWGGGGSFVLEEPPKVIRVDANLKLKMLKRQQLEKKRTELEKEIQKVKEEIGET